MIKKRRKTLALTSEWFTIHVGYNFVVKNYNRFNNLVQIYWSGESTASAMLITSNNHGLNLITDTVETLGKDHDVQLSFFQNEEIFVLLDRSKSESSIHE